MILAVLVVSLLFEALPMIAALISAPDLLALLKADDPFARFVAGRGGAGLAGATATAASLAILNAVIACILACARFFYGTARDRPWGRPVDRWLVVIHPRFGSPWASTLLIGGTGVACCFVPVTLLLVLSGTGLLAIYAGMALAKIAGRRHGSTRQTLYRRPLYPAAPILTLVALAYVVWTSWLDPEGRPGLLVTLSEMVASAAYFLLVLRGRWRAGLGEAAAPALAP